MNKNILLVEDEARMREIITDYFTREGFSILEASDGRLAVELFETEDIHLVLLDIMVPELNGWLVCKTIRKKSDVPIIMLTAKGEEEDKLLGYELGADDYVTKPFSPKVLVAKSKSLLKRVEGTVGQADGMIKCAGIELNKLSHTVSAGNELLDLAPKEYELLLYLVENRGRVLSREHILDKVWGYDYEGELRTVDTHIKKLRAKLGDRAGCIGTIIGAGYKFGEEIC